VTLDEARQCLGVTGAASADEIRDAFRRKARVVHPDRNPNSTPADLALFGREFDRAREARDILVRYTLDPLRKPPPSPPSSTPPTASARSETPRSSTSSAPHAGRPPRVTMRFEEFVAWMDAAGFGTGSRSPRYVDWVRITVWSTLGVVVAGFGSAIAYALNV
jgi:hypothetical protein